MGDAHAYDAPGTTVTRISLFVIRMGSTPGSSVNRPSGTGRPASVVREDDEASTRAVLLEMLDLMPRSVAGHRERLTGTTDRQAEADGVRPGRRAAVPSWDEIVFGTRRKKKD